jgi:hypothetical protein
MWSRTQEQATRAGVSLYQSAMPLVVAPGLRRSLQHKAEVSWGIRQPPRSCGYGTRHGYAVCATYPRSSRAIARNRLHG